MVIVRQALSVLAVVVAGLAVTATAAEFGNLSTRGHVGSGDHVLIAGLIVEGGTKRILLRGRGPSLAEAGFADALLLGNPHLQLAGSPEANDD